jgi:hypothetical protein
MREFVGLTATLLSVMKQVKESAVGTVYQQAGERLESGSELYILHMQAIPAVLSLPFYHLVLVSPQEAAESPLTGGLSSG